MPLDPAVTYVLGPGSTVGAVKAELGIDGSPLGVDVYRDGEVLARDATRPRFWRTSARRTPSSSRPSAGRGSSSAAATLNSRRP